MPRAGPRFAAGLIGRFTTLLLIACPLFAQRQVVVTVDDLPASASNQQVLRALAAGKVPAIGFVNESRVTDQNVGMLRQWLARGMLLGNHTYSHLRLYDTPLEQYEADVLRGEAITRPLLNRHGHPPLYFRHPYTSTGKTKQDKEAFEKFLAAHGYTIAPFTIENSDYMFSALYAAALQARDKEQAARLRNDYLKFTGAQFEFFEGLSRKLFSREIPQILLIHDNELNADCLGDLLAMLKKRGYSFIALDAALRDKAYATPDEYVGASGPSWMHRWTVALGVPFTLKDEPDPPDYVYAMWQKRQQR